MTINDAIKFQWLVVTPAQYQEGYFRQEGFLAYRKTFKLIRRLDDGNYLVVDPSDPNS